MDFIKWSVVFQFVLIPEKQMVMRCSLLTGKISIPANDNGCHFVFASVFFFHIILPREKRTKLQGKARRLGGRKTVADGVASSCSRCQALLRQGWRLGNHNYYCLLAVIFFI